MKEEAGAGPVSLKGYSLGSPKGTMLSLRLYCEGLKIFHNSTSRGTHLHPTLGPTNDVANLCG